MRRVLDWQLDLLDHTQLQLQCIHSYSSLQFTTTLAEPPHSLFCTLKTRSLQLTRLDCRFTVDSRLGNSARTPRLNGADPLLGSRDVYRARVPHFVYVIFVTRHVYRARFRHIVYVTSAILFTSHSTVDCCLQQARYNIFGSHSVLRHLLPMLLSLKHTKHIQEAKLFFYLLTCWCLLFEKLKPVLKFSILNNNNFSRIRFSFNCVINLMCVYNIFSQAFRFWNISK
jgi:hypothetical protein